MLDTTRNQVDSDVNDDDLLDTLSEEELNEFCEIFEPDEFYCPHAVHDVAWQNGINI